MYGQKEKKGFPPLLRRPGRRGSTGTTPHGEGMGKPKAKRGGLKVRKDTLLVDSDFEKEHACSSELESKALPDLDLREMMPSPERISKIKHILSGLEELLTLYKPESRKDIEILKARGGEELKTLLKNFAQRYFADPAWGREAPLKPDSLDAPRVVHEDLEVIPFTSHDDVPDVVVDDTAAPDVVAISEEAEMAGTPIDDLEGIPSASNDFVPDVANEDPAVLVTVATPEEVDMVASMIDADASTLSDSYPIDDAIDGDSQPLSNAIVELQQGVSCFNRFFANLSALQFYNCYD